MYNSCPKQGSSKFLKNADAHPQDYKARWLSGLPSITVLLQRQKTTYPEDGGSIHHRKLKSIYLIILVHCPNPKGEI